jgi:hypothetical protein
VVLKLNLTFDGIYFLSTTLKSVYSKAEMSYEDCPAGLFLCINVLLDTVCGLINFPTWRDSLPSSLEKTFLSHPPQLPLSEQFNKLPTYSDILSKNNDGNSLSNLYKYAFQTPTTALGSVSTQDAMVTLLILVLMLRRIKALVCPIFCGLGRKFGRSTHGPEWEKNNEEKILKFGEYVFRLLFHSFVSVYGLWAFWGQPWWDDAQGGTKNLWEGFPNQPIASSMIWYYLIQSAYNIEAMVSLLELSFIIKVQKPFGKSKAIQSPLSIQWNPNCRGDFREMAIHHVITNLLVIGSSHFRLNRCGSMVFMVHDISDVPVDMSKLANFMKWKVTTVICFVTMVITWAILRLGILPFFIYKSVLLESHTISNGTDGVSVEFFYTWRPFFFSLFAGIIMLHVFWFQVLIKIGYALTVKKELHDYSEHKNGEDQKAFKKQQ